MRRNATGALVLVVTLLTGCRSAANRWELNMAGQRSRQAAEESWQQSSSVYAETPNLLTFSQGYKAGYIHTATGGDTNKPPFPPRTLSGSGARGRENHVLVQTWLDGFSHGALAASQDRAVHHAAAETKKSPGAVTGQQAALTWSELPLPPLPSPADAGTAPDAGVQTIAHSVMASSTDLKPAAKKFPTAESKSDSAPGATDIQFLQHAASQSPPQKSPPTQRDEWQLPYVGNRVSP